MSPTHTPTGMTGHCLACLDGAAPSPLHACDSAAGRAMETSAQAGSAASNMLGTCARFKLVTTVKRCQALCLCVYTCLQVTQQQALLLPRLHHQQQQPQQRQQPMRQVQQQRQQRQQRVTPGGCTFRRCAPLMLRRDPRDTWTCRCAVADPLKCQTCQGLNGTNWVCRQSLGT